MNRWDVLFGAGMVATLFVPVLAAIVSSMISASEIQRRKDKRIAEYRKSPNSRLLILND